jgi:hypothetical protein
MTLLAEAKRVRGVRESYGPRVYYSQEYLAKVSFLAQEFRF